MPITYNDLAFGGVKGQPAPEVGMGATILLYTDRKAATIIQVHASGRMLVAQLDHAIRTDSNGRSEVQTYRYEPNPEGAKRVFRLNKKGMWVGSGGGPQLYIGSREHYHDYGF